MAAPRRLLVALLVAFVGAATLVAPAAADSSALATHLATSKVDPAKCGGLEEACCLHGSRGRCNGAGLACVPLAAQDLRCRACGGLNEPACSGRVCDKGLAPTNSPNINPPVCIYATRLPPSVNIPAAAKGADPALEKRRSENAVGQRLLGACDPKATGNDCPAGACISGYCVPCGGPNQACCNRGAACRTYAGAALACVPDAVLKTNRCAVPTSRH